MHGLKLDSIPDTLKGDEDSMLAITIFKDNWNWNIFREKIYSKIEKGSYIVSYKDRYIDLKAKEHNKIYLDLLSFSIVITKLSVNHPK